METTIKFYTDETKTKELKPFIVRAKEIADMSLYWVDYSKYIDINNPVKYKSK